MDFQVGWRPDEKYFVYSYSQWIGKRCFSVGESSSEQHRSSFWHVSDCSEWCSTKHLVFLLTPVFLRFYALEPETKQLVIYLVLIHNLFNAAAFPFSGALSNGLRAAGDVKFTMYVSVISTVAVRLLLSCILGIALQMGVIGIAIAMVCDWIIRAVLFFWRQKSGKWKNFRVI